MCKKSSGGKSSFASGKERAVFFRIHTVTKVNFLSKKSISILKQYANQNFNVKIGPMEYFKEIEFLDKNWLLVQCAWFLRMLLHIVFFARWPLWFWQTQCRLTILVLGDGGVLFYEDHSWLENIALLSLLAAFVNNNFCHFCWSLVWVASSSSW